VNVRLVSSSNGEPETREARFAEQVSRVAAAGGPASLHALLAFCDESHAAYRNQPGSAVARMRGWVLESVGRAGPLPDEALPYVLE